VDSLLQKKRDLSNRWNLTKETDLKTRLLAKKSHKGPGTRLKWKISNTQQSEQGWRVELLAAGKEGKKGKRGSRYLQREVTAAGEKEV